MVFTTEILYINDVINLIYPVIIKKNKLKKNITFLMFVRENQSI